MDFEEILDQAIAMLERRGRVSYSALKRVRSPEMRHLITEYGIIV